MRSPTHYWVHICASLVQTFPNARRSSYLGHNIAAIAVSPTGRIVDFDFNHNELFNSSAEHAEARLLRRLFALGKQFAQRLDREYVEEEFDKMQSGKELRPNRLYRCIRLARVKKIPFWGGLALFAFWLAGPFLPVAICRMARSQLLDMKPMAAFGSRKLPQRVVGGC